MSVRVSRDGGASFGDAVRVLTGEGPGRMDPSCPLRSTLAQRQRAGLAATADGVAADWPTTVGAKTSYLDSDIAVREVHLSS